MPWSVNDVHYCGQNLSLNHVVQVVMKIEICMSNSLMDNEM